MFAELWFLFGYVTSWRYFERQVSAQCGLHALNHVLGGPQFFPQDLETAAVEVAVEGDDLEDHIGVGGWYSHSVLAKALDLMVVPQFRMLFRPVEPVHSAYAALLENGLIQGIVVNQRNTHWTAIVAHESRVWHVDSLSGPEVLAEHDFLALLKRYPNSYLIVKLVEIEDENELRKNWGGL